MGRDRKAASEEEAGNNIVKTTIAVNLWKVLNGFEGATFASLQALLDVTMTRKQEADYAENGERVFTITIFADIDLQCEQAKELIKSIRLISFKVFCYKDRYSQIVKEVRQNCSVSLLKYDQKSSMWIIGAAITCFNAGENAVRYAVELVRNRKSASFPEKMPPMWKVELDTFTKSGIFEEEVVDDP